MRPTATEHRRRCSLAEPLSLLAFTGQGCAGPLQILSFLCKPYTISVFRTLYYCDADV